MTEQTVIESGVIRVDASGRRQYSVEFKRRLAKLALEPGASVAGIALAHRINAKQMFKWRQDYLRQRGEATALEPAPKPEPAPEPEATLLPVVVAPAGRAPIEPAVLATMERETEPPPMEPGQIEIALGRARVRMTGPVDPALLKTILTCIHGDDRAAFGNADLARSGVHRLAPGLRRLGGLGADAAGRRPVFRSRLRVPGPARGPDQILLPVNFPVIRTAGRVSAMCVAH